MNYFKYSNILDVECFKNENVENNELHQISEDKLKNLLKNHIKKNKIVISLSGGVDSMVLFHILKRVSNNEIIIVHINYNNRDESTMEADFLEEYSKHLDVKMIRHDITHIKRFQKGINRSEYEQESRDIRYNLYRKIQIDENIDGIYLAHHDGDVIENIFNNVMKNNTHSGDLAVLKSENTINGVKVIRPFLGIKKDTILHYANRYNVPYFKDTTPMWSCRGIMRNDIFPNCRKCYGNDFEDNLIKFSKEVKEINDIVTIIMKPYMGYTILRNDCVLLDLNLTDDILIFPVIFWQMLFNKICNDLQMPLFSKKSIDNFHKNLLNDNNIIMSKNVHIVKYLGKIYVYTKTKY